MSDFPSFLAARVPAIDAALDRLLPPSDDEPRRLHEAMRYAIFAGGKRIRPALTVLAGETLGAPTEPLLLPAAALELIHTFSLVHDDLPALDDDDLRRGRPTVHRQYDEALAVLVGDALLDLGLQALAEHPSELGPAARLRNVSLVARAVGGYGMIGGQVADLEAENRWPDDPAATLRSIHRRKTGALLVASLQVGAVCAGAGEEQLALLDRLGHLIGLIFQIRDDILDVESTSEALGKTAGKDEAANKLTYPRVFGLEPSKRQLEDLRHEAEQTAGRLPGGGGLFLTLLRYLAERSH